ncbi:hypothetical protein [Sutcliffiella halmapala]|uniref:hypothetical protein n=1 Tax=Sutcliffiella halmapala TaxID=79882 RepID=UPI00099506CC|nr:hypothetical protein [Sutcliffiella halmapala]
MGLFFQKMKKKSSKSMMVVRLFVIFIMVILLATGIIKGFDSIFFGLFFIISGIGSIIDGTENYFHRENKRVYLVNYGLAFVCFVASFTFFELI